MQIPNALPHFLATVFSIAGLVILVVSAAESGTARHVVSFSLFGASLILAYLTGSLARHLADTNRLKHFFARLDSGAFYLLIAGTYTPLMLISVKGTLGIAATSIIWTLALTGVTLYAFLRRIIWWIPAAILLSIAALDATTFFPVKAMLPEAGFGLLMAGSICYGLGILVFGTSRFSLAQRIPALAEYGMAHYFIIAGSGIHFWLMFQYLAYL